MQKSTFDQRNQRVHQQTNLNVQGDYVIRYIVKEKVSIFSGFLNRFILAQNILVGIVFSFLRYDPIPYAKSFKMVALCISADNEKVEAWFKEWFSELNELINNPQTASDLNRIASELGLVIELIEKSYEKNKSSTERVTTLIADFQRIRGEAIESLSNYSQELAKAHSNLVHLQSILNNSSSPIQEHLKIVVNWIGLLVSYTKNFTPTNLLEKIDKYVRQNPDDVSPLILGMLSNIEYLLIWTIEWTSKNSESKFKSELGRLLSTFPNLIPPIPSPDKASKSTTSQLDFVLQQAREQLQKADHLMVSNQQEIKSLHQELDKLTQENSHLMKRLSVSNEQINQTEKTLQGRINEVNRKDKTLQEKISEIKKLESELSNLASKQSKLERKLVDVTQGIHNMKEFLVETQNKASSVGRENQMLEMVTSLLNESEAKNQQSDQQLPHWSEKTKKKNHVPPLTSIAYSPPNDHVVGDDKDQPDYPRYEPPSVGRDDFKKLLNELPPELHDYARRLKSQGFDTSEIRNKTLKGGSSLINTTRY